MNEYYYFCYIHNSIFRDLVYKTQSKRLMRAWRRKHKSLKYEVKYGKTEKTSYTLHKYDFETL